MAADPGWGAACGASVADDRACGTVGAVPRNPAAAAITATSAGAPAARRAARALGPVTRPPQHRNTTLIALFG